MRKNAGDQKYQLKAVDRLIVLLDGLKEIIWDELEAISPGTRNPKSGTSKVISQNPGQIKAVCDSLDSLSSALRQGKLTKIDPQSTEAKQLEVGRDFFEDYSPETPSKQPDIQEAIAWINKDREINPEEDKAIARIRDGSEELEDYYWVMGPPRYREPTNTWIIETRKIDPKEDKASAQIKDGNDDLADYYFEYPNIIHKPARLKVRVGPAERYESQFYKALDKHKEANYRYGQGNVFAYRFYLKREYEKGHIHYLIEDEYGDSRPADIDDIYSLYSLPPSFEWIDFVENYWNNDLYSHDLELLLRFYVNLDEALNIALNDLSQLFSAKPIDRIDIENRIKAISLHLSETCSRLLKVLKWKVSHFQNEFLKEGLESAWPEFNITSPFYAPVSDSGKCLFLAGLLGYSGSLGYSFGYFSYCPIAGKIKKEILDSELIGLNTLGFDLAEYFRGEINEIKDTDARREQELAKREIPLKNKLEELTKGLQFKGLELQAEMQKRVLAEGGRDSAQEQLSKTISENQFLFFQLNKAETGMRKLQEELDQQNVFSRHKKEEFSKQKGLLNSK